jgi:hypothetical protein
VSGRPAPQDTEKSDVREEIAIEFGVIRAEIQHEFNFLRSEVLDLGIKLDRLLSVRD